MIRLNLQLEELKNDHNQKLTNQKQEFIINFIKKIKYIFMIIRLNLQLEELKNDHNQKLNSQKQE